MTDAVQTIDGGAAAWALERSRKKFKRAVVCEIVPATGAAPAAAPAAAGTNLGVLTLHLNTCRAEPVVFAETFLSKCAAAQPLSTELYAMIYDHARRADTTVARHNLRATAALLCERMPGFRRKLDSALAALEVDSDPRALVRVAPFATLRDAMCRLVASKTAAGVVLATCLGACTERYRDGAWPARAALLDWVYGATVKLDQRELRLRMMNLEEELGRAPPVPGRRAQHR